MNTTTGHVWGLLLVAGMLGLVLSAQTGVFAQGPQSDALAAQQREQQREQQFIAAINPSPGQVASQYDATPAPAATSAEKISAVLAQVHHSLCFLGRVSASGNSARVPVETDSFLVPNARYATLHFTWKSLLGADGKNVLRQPTAQEKAMNDEFPQYQQLYLTTAKCTPMSATGAVQLVLPIAFAHVDFAAGAVNTQQSAAPFTATLLRCKNDVATVKVQGVDPNKVIIVLRDAAGGRLREAFNTSSQESDFGLFTYKAIGMIAKVEVFVPTEFARMAQDVLATAEPHTVGGAAITVKSPRYVLPTGDAVADVAMEQETLKAQTALTACRISTEYGLNTPGIAVELPKVVNSAYAKVEFSEPKLTDATGKTVKNVRAYLNLADSRVEQYFYNPKEHFVHPIDFAHAAGTVKIRYPARLAVLTLTPARPGNGAVAAKFHGALVWLSGVDWLQSNTALRAYDATGRQLKPLTHSGCKMVNNVTWQEYAFWGNVTELRVVVGEQWLTLDLPYNLPPAARLPGKGTK